VTAASRVLSDAVASSNVASMKPNTASPSLVGSIVYALSGTKSFDGAKVNVYWDMKAAGGAVDGESVRSTTADVVAPSPSTKRILRARRIVVAA
jgi:hypothetical protein